MHVSRGRRAGLRFDADNGVATEALLFLGQLDPEAIGPSLEDATHYEPTPPADFEALLDAAPIAAETTTFLDLGCGLGRTLLLAARRPFRQVVGVEISPALAEIARDNLRSSDPALRVCRDVRIVCADAKTAKLPAGDLLVYLYNPFRGEVMRSVVERLAAAGGRTIVIVYHTPEERHVFDAGGAFEVIAELPPGIVFRRRT